MNARSTIELCIAVLAVGLIIFLTEVNPSEPRPSRKAGAPVMALRVDEVMSLTCQTPSNRIECVRQGGDWFIRSPVTARAAGGAIERVLSVLEGLEIEELVTAEQRQNRELGLADYGLDPPVARLVLADSAGTRELAIGREAPLGNHVYVRLSGGSDVFSTSRELLDVIPGGVDEWRDRRLMAGELSRCIKLDVRRPGEGFIRLVRSNGRWVFRQPLTGPANDAGVMSILERILDAQIVTFVGGPDSLGVPVPPVKSETAEVPAAAEADVPRGSEEWGFTDETAIRVDVMQDGDMTGREIVLGRPVPGSPGLIYARAADSGSVVTVSSNLLGALAFKVADLRDHALLRFDPANIERVTIRQGEKRVVAEKMDGAWSLAEPITARADDRTIQSIISGLAGWEAKDFVPAERTNAVAQILLSPWCEIELDAGGPKGPAQADSPSRADRWQVVLSSPTEGDGLVYARVGSEDAIYEIPASVLSAMPAEPTDPASYRDRMVLALPPADIRRITLLRSGVEQSVWRTDAGMWTSPGGTNDVNPAAVAATLELVSGLRALRIEAELPASMDVYGLGDGANAVTFSLSGAQGIQKTIRLGFRARTDGVYAGILGQEIVYVIPLDAVGVLTTDLLSVGQARR